MLKTVPLICKLDCCKVGYVIAYRKSLEVGGPNEHISPSLGHIPYPDRAVIRHNNQARQVVVEWRAGASQAWS